jgi:hypothetical protein
MNKVHNTPIPAHVRIKRYPAKYAYGAHTWAKKGGMMGGSGGACRGVTSGNGVGVVPMAFVENKRTR